MSPTGIGRAERARGPGEASPSSWRHRLPVLVLLLFGLAFALDLALVQLGILPAWDPLFGDGTSRVLTSGPARAVPVPDAALGAVAYAIEAALVLPGGSDRWTTSPWPPAVLGALSIAMALGGIGLVLLQALVVRAFCTLCLGSAAVSIAAAVLDWPEARAAFGQVRDRRRPARGRPPQAHRLSSPRR